MARALKTTGLLILGMLFGGLATNHVWVVESELYTRVVRASYIHEQERLRSRAGREGDDVEVLLRSLNIADAEAGTGFRWLARAGNQSYAERSSSPWSTATMVAAGDFESDPQKQAKGGKIGAAMARGRAALALERVGLAEAAEEQWRLAEALTPDWPATKIRDLAESSEAWDDDFLTRLLEDAYLETTTFAELNETLLRGREALLKSVDGGRSPR